MAKTATTRSDILEREFEAGVVKLIPAGIILALAGICLWAARVTATKADPTVNTFATVYVAPSFYLLAFLGFAVSLVLCIIGVKRIVSVRKVPLVTVACPFCGHEVHFPNEPTTDWDCEKCHRHVPYENGEMVPVKEITCTFCSTVHRVSSKATSYVCDQCNRPLKMNDPNDPTKVVAEQSELLRNYDVILTQVGRNPNDVALALESILFCNLREARQQMENLPLTIARNVMERKADALKRKLRDLGATAVVRPTRDDSNAK